VCIKFCVKLAKNGVETLNILKTAYGENALSCTTVFEWHKRLKKAEVMLIVFFNIKGFMHHEYIPKGHTVNQKYYVEVLKRLRDAV
jgi:hypothetical protein